MSGKNFSCNNATGKRRKNDFYQTPLSMTQQLLDVEHFDKSKIILEPACGHGAISSVLINNGFAVIATDVENDFLKSQIQYRQIITNPPFSLAYQFILKAKTLAIDKFAMLLPLSYLHGKERLDHIWLDKQFPLSVVHVFCRYPLLEETIRKDGKYKTGMMVYAWFVWEKSHIGQPVIKWIDNQKYILSSKDNVNDK